MASKKIRSRTERRNQERGLTKLAEGREKLARLEPGGDPKRPILVETASVIEVQGTSGRCLRCDGEVRVEEHRAETHEGRMLRALALRCRMCGAARTLYFEIRAPLPN